MTVHYLCIISRFLEINWKSLNFFSTRTFTLITFNLFLLCQRYFGPVAYTLHCSLIGNNFLEYCISRPIHYVSCKIWWQATQVLMSIPKKLVPHQIRTRMFSISIMQTSTVSDLTPDLWLIRGHKGNNHGIYR